MKKVLVLLVFASVAVQLSAQSAQATFEASLPDSVKYVRPTFSKGTILYRDGGYSSAPLNISTLDGTLRYLETDGSEKTLVDESNVAAVSFAGTVYIRPQSAYLETIRTVDEVSLCVEKRIRFDESKGGAYGGRSETTNIKTMQSADAVGGVRFDLSEIRYELRTKAFVVRKGRVWVPSRKRMEKLFPAKKELLAAYLEQNKVDFENVDDLTGLFDALK